MNKCTIHGRLVRDPERRNYNTKDGSLGVIATITVAVDRRFGDVTDYFICKSFGKQAETILKYFKKGREIVVSGEMNCEPYDGDDGKKRYPWSLHIQEFDFCGSKKDDNAPSAEPKDSFKTIDEDVPF